MRTIKNLFLIIIAMFLFISLSGCDEKDPIDDTNADPTLSVDVSQFTLRPGDKALIVPILDGNISNVSYQSKNELIATVNQGEITAITEGEVIIVLSLIDNPQVKTEVTITVLKPYQEEIGLIKDWVLNNVSLEVSSSINLPKTHPDYPDAIISYESSDETIISNDGVLNQSEYDKTVDLTISIEYHGLKLQETVTITIIGYAFGSVALDFLGQFKKLITRNYDVVTTNFYYPEAIITWTSSNTKVFTNQGMFYQPLNDTPITITADITIQGKTHQFSKTVSAQGVPIYEIAEIIKNETMKELNITDYIDTDIELPQYNEIYSATLTWTSDKPKVINEFGTLVKPDLNQLINLKCTISIGDKTTFFIINCEVAGKNYNEKWIAIEAFLNYITYDEIKTQKYTVGGVGDIYYGYNNGYLPFYVNSPSTILDGMVDPSLTSTRPGRIKTETKYIVIHDTANNKPGASALMHKNYIQNGPQSVSWHYSIDDVETYQHIPDEEVAWHAGTSEGNYYGIGIETCINPESDYTVVMRRTAKLVSELLDEFNLSLIDVKQHNWFSGKDCPQVMRSQNRWNEFLELVTLEYFAKTKLEGVNFVWESLSPSILDNTGRVYNHPGIATDVSYKVSITYQNVTKEYTFTSKLLPQSWLL